jgi:hypothetical protein
MGDDAGFAATTGPHGLQLCHPDGLSTTAPA